MEMAIMQQSAVRSLHSRQASTSGRSSGAPNSLIVYCSLNSPWKRGKELGRRVTCQSSGGSRRDQQKMVARTQKRRSRHVKGVTPTKPELFDILQKEEEGDEQLEAFFQDDDGDDDDDDEESEGSAGGGEIGEGVLELRGKVSFGSDLTGKLRSGTASTNGNPQKQSSDSNHGMKVENQRWDQESNEDKKNDVSNSADEEIVQTGEDSYPIRYFPEGTKKQAGVEDEIQKQVEDEIENVGEITGKVADIAQDTGRVVGSTVNNTAEETGRNLSEAGDAIQEAVGEGLDQAGGVAEEVTNIAQETAKDVAETTQKTAEESGESLREAGDAIGDTLSELGTQGQHEVERSLSQISSQAQESGERTWGAVEKITSEARKSAETVGQSLTKPISDSSRAVETVGSEALRLGEVVLSTVGEAAGFTEDSDSGPESRESIGSQPRPAATKNPKLSQVQNKNQQKGGDQVILQEKPISEESWKKEDEQDQGEDLKDKKLHSKESEQRDKDEKDKNPYTGLKVLVAGANGRTGRLIVEELVSKGVPVRALVRDTTKARDLKKLPNVEVVQADLYKYESLRSALEDSNVVICATGAQSFLFDPFGTYQAEFEGVKNLVAAARNQGKVKKFVFVTSLGVTFLQLIPLIFWKKQAEMYLQRSGLDYTIIRPGGLTNDDSKREGVEMRPADTHFGGSISRRKVAEVCVSAVVTPEASEKIVEVVSGGATGIELSGLFRKV